MKKVLVVDNSDSFVYNLVEYLRIGGNCEFDIVICDDVDLASLSQYDGILLSPGAGVPSNYPIMLKVIDICRDSHSIFGVCLGLQAIVSYFGGEVTQLDSPRHGHQSVLSIIKPNDIILNSIVNGCSIGRYHSCVADEATLPETLEITSRDEHHNIMSITHKSKRIYGVQYHPESILTTDGQAMIDNWVNSL